MGVGWLFKIVKHDLNHRRCLSLEQVVFGLWHRNILFMSSDGR